MNDNLQHELDMTNRRLQELIVLTRRLSSEVVNLESRLAWIEDYLNRHGETDQPPPQV